MNITLPLDQMTIEDKIKTMETLWDDLCRKAEDMPSPEWHGEILREREERVKQGKEGFTAWEEAKKEYADLMQNKEKFAREKYYISKPGEDVYIIE